VQQSRYRIKLSEEQEQIKRKIKSYGYSYLEEYEKEIISYLTEGYFNEQKLIDEIKKLSDKRLENKKTQELNEKLIKLWGIYNNNFTKTDSLFLTEASNFISKNIDTLSYGQLQELIKHIKKIDNNRNTQAYINSFIDSHKESFSETDIKFFSTQTTDKDIIAKLNQKNNEIIGEKSLKSIIYKMVRNSSWNTEDEEYLDLHSEDEIYKWLKEEADTELLKMIRGALRIFQATSGNTKRESFGRKLYNCLLKIWQEGDTLDKLRITDFLNIVISAEEEKADSHPPSPT